MRIAPPSALLQRRLFLKGAGALGLIAPFGATIGDVAAGPELMSPLGLDWPMCRTAAEEPAHNAGPLRKINFAWNATAACLPTITAALDKGFFAKHGLDVSLVNYSGSTDQLLETLATGKADAAVGMALRWLKPLEQGFDVKIVSGLHGGCMRLIAPKSLGVSDLKGLKGKTIAVSDMNSPAKNFFAIQFKKSRDRSRTRYRLSNLSAAFAAGGGGKG